MADPVSLWFRSAKPEQRPQIYSPAPYPVLAPGSYADLDLSSAESALQSIAVHSAADLIASLCSELPVEVYSGEGLDRRSRATPGNLKDPSGEGQGLEDWSYQLVLSWLLRGNAFGDILEGTVRQPRQVLLQHPDDVTGWIEDGTPVWNVRGRQVDAARWMHRRVMPVAGRVLGVSPIQFHASTVGLSITSVKFGESWFRDGAHPSALLTNEEAAINEQQARDVKNKFLAALRGNREPVVMGKGWKYQAIQISPEESQFLATQGYTEAQCARMFGPGIAEVLGYESGGSLTYANVESRASHLLVLTINKWLRRLERALSSLLPAPQYVVIPREGILQATTLDKYRSYESALRNRWKTVNEIRQGENLQPVSWGNKPNTAGTGGAQGKSGDPDDDTDNKEDGTP
ncbi:hypothetical protein BB31_11545 [Amycolatopsis lurida NRRL 2430]|uniref:Portal protein n=1 Tax=Amycolatopsis lurida NRRL 2430 TaxID=1460371 RepID=A0A2P2FW96_AMYLU|nr:hypothetical protein BB31_11545 [Amycolatopsis lurida NRRL 2430]